MKLSAIKKNPNNPRLIKDQKFERLKSSLQEFPQMMELRPIIVDAENMILGGNMRFEAVKALGYKEIPDAWIKRADELTPEQKREFIIKDNASFGEWDWDLLANEWDANELLQWGLDLPEGFEVQQIVAAEEDEQAVAEMIDRAGELQAKWQTEQGQLWQIGRHRLLCGDSTKREDVDRVLDGNKPLLMITDPPYGVEYDPEWREEADLGIGVRSKGKVQNDDRADWTDAWLLSPCDVAYVWHAGIYAGEVALSLLNANLFIRSQIIWVKQQFVLSRGAYHWQHEPCWYAVRKGRNAHWIGDRKQSTFWQIANNNPFGNSAEKEETWGHGTQKPVECMSRPMRNHEGDVYEPFSGSGTTFVAAEQLNRTCYGIEIDPRYVAVILERLAVLGLEAKLADDAEIQQNSTH